MAAPEELPATSVRSSSETGTVVLIMRDSILRAEIPELCRRVQALLDGGGVDGIVCDVGAVAHPDAVAVDALARLQLIARRCGHRVRLRHTRAELRDLLALMGLGEVVTP